MRLNSCPLGSSSPPASVASPPPPAGAPWFPSPAAPPKSPPALAAIAYWICWAFVVGVQSFVAIERLVVLELLPVDSEVDQVVQGVPELAVVEPPIRGAPMIIVPLFILLLE